METRSLASNWNQLSILLGLPSELIDNIRCKAGDNYYYWSEALKQWIQQNYNTKMFGKPSWRNLLKAIAKVDKLQFKELTASPMVKGEHLELWWLVTVHNCTIDKIN